MDNNIREYLNKLVQSIVKEHRERWPDTRVPLETVYQEAIRGNEYLLNETVWLSDISSELEHICSIFYDVDYYVAGDRFDKESDVIVSHKRITHKLKNLSDEEKKNVTLKHICFNYYNRIDKSGQGIGNYNIKYLLEEIVRF